MKERIPLKDKPWLSIPQCQRLMSKGREWVEARIASGDFRWIKDGCRVKIDTESVREWVDAQTRAQRDAVGLATP